MDDAFHLVMQCPKLQDKRNAIFSEIKNMSGGINLNTPNTEGGAFWVLVGRPAINISNDIMEVIWVRVARHVSNMYRWKMKQGVGYMHSLSLIDL